MPRYFAFGNKIVTANIHMHVVLASEKFRYRDLRRFFRRRFDRRRQFGVFIYIFGAYTEYYVVIAVQTLLIFGYKRMKLGELIFGRFYAHGRRLAYAFCRV